MASVKETPLLEQELSVKSSPLFLTSEQTLQQIRPVRACGQHSTWAAKWTGLARGLRGG